MVESIGCFRAWWSACFSGGGNAFRVTWTAALCFKPATFWAVNSALFSNLTKRECLAAEEEAGRSQKEGRRGF